MKHSVKISALSFLLPFVVFAHGTGASVEQTVGDYFIDIGYSPTEVSAGEAVRLDFSVLNKANREEVAFTDIWLRIMKGNQTVFAGGLSRARFGLTGITYTFHEPGEYQISLRFENDRDAIVETDFSFAVEKGSALAQSLVAPRNILILVGGAVLGSLITLFGKRKKQ